MLIDTDITLAYKCYSCGSFEFFNISLFSLPLATESYLTCHCNKSNVAVKRISDKDYQFRIPCIGCGNVHTFTTCRKDMLSGSVNAFNCPETGIKQCFIGNDECVRKKVDSLEKELDGIIDMFGFDSYFKNTQVMFDSLNKIHDIAEKGNLLCECGSRDIELVLLSDKIYLKCRKCSGNKIIYATSNEDLKNILTSREILLLEGFPGYTAGNINGFLEKTDRK